MIKLLPLFQKPGRYTDHEVNAIRKSWEGAKLRVLLAYPDTYEIGMSSYGYQLIYYSANKTEGVLCDRAFLPWIDALDYMIAGNIPIWGLETKRPAHQFDIVAFSLHYELSYTNLLWFLKASRIPLFCEDRKEHHPIVVAGGPCTSNPAPLTPFVDAFFIGEWDAGIQNVLLKLSQTRSRRERISILAETEGVYVPSLSKTSVKRRIEDLSIHPVPIVPLIDIPHNRITVEIARGCIRGCRFCHAGFIYRPLRERSPQEVIKIVSEALKQTGYEEVSLLALSATDYSHIEDLVVNLSRLASKSIFSIALPSFRAGTLTERIIESIRNIKKTGFTIAPEAGTQRLRDVINKQISEEEIVETVEKATSAGWQTIKLYFMIGLPTETEEDVEAIGDLIARLLRISSRLKRRPRFNITVSPFVPKPHTPFQWEEQESLTAIREKIDYLQRRFKRSRARIKNHDPHQSIVEALLSRGNNITWKVIYRAFQLGARFDQWGEIFNFKIWKRAMEENGIDPETPSPSLPANSPLPWDVVDVGVSKSFLLREWEKALRNSASPACMEGCRRCGICLKVPLRVSSESTIRNLPALPEFRREKKAEVTLFLSKKGMAKLIGQNDLQDLLHRAMRRAGVPLAYSRGYSPRPLISFIEAIPLGVECEMEPVKIGLWKKEPLASLMNRINLHLPEGVKIKGATAITTKATSARYRIILDKTDLKKDWQKLLPNHIQIIETPSKVILFYEDIPRPLRLVENLLSDPQKTRCISINRICLSDTNT